MMHFCGLGGRPWDSLVEYKYRIPAWVTIRPRWPQYPGAAWGSCVRERLFFIGGKLQVQSVHGHGTVAILSAALSSHTEATVESTACPSESCSSTTTA
jgi:hypothetical protein